ncbi:MAG: hypothetical protein S4CHLAM37_07050 [Chlamydiia bacterium]|nr:hypothetical protein [Chlamydiia bacterium]
MKYRTKLFLTFSLLVFISTSIALVTLYAESSRLLFAQIRGELLSIAVTTAASINGDEIESFQSKQSVNTAAYKKIDDELRFIRDANRRPNLYIQYMYIIRPAEKADHFVFVMDPEENPEKSSHYGDLFPTMEELYQNEDRPFVESKLTYDHWGRWISAFAPIYDSQGVVAATLGVDVSIKEVQSKMYTLILYGIIALASSLIISIIIAHLLSKLVTNSLSQLVVTVNEIGGGDLKARSHLESNDEFDELSSAINAMAKGLEERERLKLGFARYVSQYVLEKILKSEVPANLEGERRRLTVFFSDIRSFTKISENLAPEVVVSLLNQYFERMIAVIFLHNGTLDKFIGDGIMAEFGAPLEDKQQELHAVRAALDMQIEIQKLTEKWKDKGLPEISVGMGVHTGYAVVGNIGSEIRMEYTAVGDAVNVAARLEKSTKRLNKQIIISEETYKAIKNLDEFTFEDLGEVELTGREQYIHSYAIEYKVQRNTSALGDDGKPVKAPTKT